jgi:hypothetical protein
MVIPSVLVKQAHCAEIVLIQMYKLDNCTGFVERPLFFGFPAQNDKARRGFPRRALFFQSGMLAVDPMGQGQRR